MREAGELPTLPGPGVLCQAAVMTRDDTPVPSAEEVPGAQWTIERSLVTPRVTPPSSPRVWKPDIPQMSLPDSRLLSGHRSSLSLAPTNAKEARPCQTCCI